MRSRDRWSRPASPSPALPVPARPVCCVLFFQAEDGIRDVAVTGVQTCALPISLVYRVWVVTQQNLLPDRVFVRKEAMRKRFVHDNRPRRGLCIVIIKIAPLFQRNLEDRKSVV